MYYLFDILLIWHGTVSNQDISPVCLQDGVFYWTAPVISPKITRKCWIFVSLVSALRPSQSPAAEAGPLITTRYRSAMEPPDNSHQEPVTYSHEIFRIFGSLFILLNNQQLTILTNMYSSKTIFIPPKPRPLLCGCDIVVTRDPVKTRA